MQMTKEQWEQGVKDACRFYFDRHDGRYNDVIKGALYECNYEEQTISVIFETSEWEINERGTIHGGALAGMYESSMGIAANFCAGPTAAITCDFSVTFINGMDFGHHAIVKIYVVKNGRKLIRLRAEMYCQETGKLLSTCSGTWMPLG